MAEKNVMNNFAVFYHDYYTEIIKTRAIIHNTYKCPLRCPFCMRTTQDIKKFVKESSELSVDNLSKIIKTFKTGLTLTGTMSDPIYQKDFLDILKFLNDQKYYGKIVIQTNGSRRKKEFWEEAFKLTSKKSKMNVIWTFGLDGTDQQTANKHRVNTEYENVLDMMKLGSSMGAVIEWQFIAFEHNEHQIEDVKMMCQKFGFIFSLVKSNRWWEPIMDKHKIYPPKDLELRSKDSATMEKIIIMPRKN